MSITKRTFEKLTEEEQEAVRLKLIKEAGLPIEAFGFPSDPNYKAEPHSRVTITNYDDEEDDEEDDEDDDVPY